MTADPKSATRADDPALAVMQPWLDYWTHFVEQRSDWAQMMMAATPPNVDLAQLRKRWLDTLTKSIDAYLRTPAFLDSMRRNLEATTALKSSTDAAQREASRQAGMPHVDDIAGLYERLEMCHAEQMEKLNTLERRLTTLEKRLQGDGKPADEAH